MAGSGTDDVTASLDKLEAVSENEQVLELLEVVRTIFENQQTLTSNQRNSKERNERIELLENTLGTFDEVEGVNGRGDPLDRVRGD